jgi:hypothetical protein
LDHEAVNDAVDRDGFVVQLGRLFARAESTKTG